MNWLKQQAANIAGTAEPIYGPSALQSVAEQAKTTPYTETTKNDVKWRAMSSTSVESHVFYIMADNGHFGLAQVIYSNVAGIRTTAQFNCKIIYPNESKPHLWSSDHLENYGFDEDHYSFYADGCAMDLSEDGRSYTVKSATNDASLVNLKITQGPPGFKVGKDGTSYFGTDPKEPWGSMLHVFWPRCHVEGSITTKDGEIDFKGRALFIHALQGMKPHHAAAKWNFLNFHTPTYSAIMMQFTTPPSYGTSKVTVGGIATDNEILFAGGDNSVTVTETRDDPDWPEPGAIDWKWKGKTKEGKTVEAEVSGNLGKRIDKIDVMIEVPKFVKNIVGNVAGTRPFIYQYSPQPPLQLKVKVEGEEEKAETGRYFGEATFICE